MPTPHIILPDSGEDILRLELEQAFRSLGCPVTRVRPDHLHDPEQPHYLPALLRRYAPALLLSVNFQGLNPLKWVLQETQKSGSDVAVWCVDNPWNLLSGVRDPRWKDLLLFVTDKSFIPDLQRHGAARARHLPLAGWPGGFAPNPAREEKYPPPTDLAPVVFVGRSAFPGKEAFFAGQSVPGHAAARAETMLRSGLRPDLSWWAEELGLAGKTFWPGKLLRQASLGAEESSLAWRSLCLASVAGDFRLDVLGDRGWQGLLPHGARLLPPVDYYARLPGIYQKARYSLALTSLQLPHGLNQRHFDVWLAGGFCLTDKTPGLDLFPPELVRPVAFSSAKELPALIKTLEKSTGLRRELQAAWTEHILNQHTYRHRAEYILASRENTPGIKPV